MNIKCMGCKAYSKDIIFTEVREEGSGDKTLLVIGVSPTRYELELKTSWVSPKARQTLKLLKSVFPECRIVLTNIIRCSTHLRTKQVVETCVRKYLIPEIKKADFIVSVGELPRKNILHIVPSYFASGFMFISPFELEKLPKPVPIAFIPFVWSDSEIKRARRTLERMKSSKEPKVSYSSQAEFIISDVVAVDFETISVSDKTPIAVGIAYDDKVYVIEGREEIKRAIELISGTPIFFNSQFDLEVWRGLGIKEPDFYYELEIYAHNYDMENNINQSLEGLAMNFGIGGYKSLIPERNRMPEIQKRFPEKFREYTALDAYTTLKIFSEIRNQLGEVFDEFYKDVLFPALKMFGSLEGIRIDQKKVSQVNAKLSDAIRNLSIEIIKEAYERYGVKVRNMNSTLEKSKLLEAVINTEYRDKIDVGDYLTDTGKITTTRQFLNELLEIKYVPLIEKLIEYSKINKLKTTYVDSLQKLVKADGRIHPRFHVVSTATGRVVSSEPNFQQIPRGDNDWEKVLRSIFIPEPGNMVISVDFSQAELRVAGLLSQDPVIIKAFNSETTDIHSETAKIILRIEGLEETAENIKTRRQMAKSVNFAIIYGIKPETLSSIISTDEKTAEDIIKGIKKKWKRYFRWGDEVAEEGKRNGYIRTPFGRRRMLVDYVSEHEIWKLAVNTMIQSVSSDIALRFAIEIWRAGYKIWGTIHDSVVFEAPEVPYGLLEEIRDKTIPSFLQKFGIEPRIRILYEVKSGRDYSFDGDK